MTAFDILRTTTGLWRRSGNGQVICPLEGCGLAVNWADHARLTHLRFHIRDGSWPPKNTQTMEGSAP